MMGQQKIVNVYFMKFIFQYMYTFKLIFIKLLKFNDYKILRIIMKFKFDIKIYFVCRCNNDFCILNLIYFIQVYSIFCYLREF